MARSMARLTVGSLLATLVAATSALGGPVSNGPVSGNAPSGLSWQSIATGTALPVVVNGVATSTPGAYVLWNVRSGQLQLEPNGLNLNNFSLVYASGTGAVTATTPGPLSYPQGTSPATLQVSGTASAAAKRALPAGTWNNVTVWGSRIGGTVSRSPTGTPTLATAGENTASTNGWLNATWSFPSTLVSSGSVANMIVSDWRGQGVVGSPNANVIGFGEYQSTFTYTTSGTQTPGAQVGAVVPTGLLSLAWNTVSGTWDHDGQDWTDEGALPQRFHNLDRVTFGGAAGGTVTVTGTQSPSAFAVSATSGTYTFAGGAIGGYANLAKSGGGTAVFASANTWTGGTTLSEGTLRGGHDAAFGTGTLTLVGGTVASADGGARTFANPVSIGGDVTIGDSVGTGSVAFTGAVGLGGAQRTVTTVADTSFSGGVSGGGLTKAGPATLVVGGTGGFSGTVAVDAGTLAVGPSGVLSTAQVTVAPGATLSVLGLVQSFGGTVTVDGTLSGIGTIEGDTTIRGVHSPGTTAPGAGTFLGDLFYQQAGIAVPRVDWRLNANTSVFQAGTTYDKLVVQNDLAFQSNTTMNLAFDRQGSTVSWADPFWSQDRTFTVYEVGGATSGAARLQLDPSQSYQDSTNQPLNAIRPDARFGIRQQGQNVTVVYYATPEPSTWGMAAGAAGIAALAGWRRGARRRRPPCRAA